MDEQILLDKLTQEHIILLRVLVKKAEKDQVVASKYLWSECGGEKTLKTTYRGITKMLVKLEKLGLVFRGYRHDVWLSDKYPRAYWGITYKGIAVVSLLSLN